jgi:hypothetical protein
MEEGKITAWDSLVRLKESINVYKNACTAGNTFVSVGQVGINFILLVNQPVVLLVQLNVQEWKKVR